jgi:alpha-tubulin suppressor-like RCC1 family protein
MWKSLGRVKKDADNDLDNIVYIDAGFLHSMAIDKYGNFWVWGRNQKGQLGLGDEQLRYYATKIQ